MTKTIRTCTGLFGVFALGCFAVWFLQNKLQDRPVAQDDPQTFAEDDLLGESLPAPLETTPAGPATLPPQSEPALQPPPPADASFRTAGTPRTRTSPSTTIPADSAFPPAESAFPPAESAFPPAEATQPDTLTRGIEEPPTFPVRPATALTGSTPPPLRGDAPPTTALPDPPSPEAPGSLPPLTAASNTAPPASDAPLPPARPQLSLETPAPGTDAEPPANVTSPGAAPRGTFPEPPPLDDLTATPAAITPDTAAPATTGTSRDDLLGRGTVDSATPRGIQQPQLEIEKTAPPNGQLGTPLVYTIRVRNTGSTAAHAVTVEDQVPQGTRLTGTIPQAELADGRLSWKLGTLAPGAAKKILVRIVPISAGEIGSIATVRFAARTSAVTRIKSDTPPLDTPPLDTTPLTGPAPLADAPVTLKVDAPASVAIGEVATLTFTITNRSRTDSNEIMLRNVIPAQFHHPAGNDLEYPLKSLAAGKSQTIKLKLTARSAGRAVNRATLSSGQDVYSTSNAPIDVTDGQTIEIEQSHSGPATVGQPLSLATKIKNTTNQATAPATLVQSLPAGVEFIKASAGGKYDPINGQITWALPALSSGTSQQFLATVRPLSVASLTSLVQVKSEGNTLSESTASFKTAGFAAPTIQLTGMEDPAEVGKPLAVQLTISNRGSGELTGAKLALSPSSRLQLTGIKGASERIGGAGAKTLLDLPETTIGAGKSVEITLTFRSLSAGQAQLQCELTCDQLEQPLSRSDAVILLPAGTSP